MLTLKKSQRFGNCDEKFPVFTLSVADPSFSVGWGGATMIYEHSETEAYYLGSRIYQVCSITNQWNLIGMLHVLLIKQWLHTTIFTWYHTPVDNEAVVYSK